MLESDLIVLRLKEGEGMRKRQANAQATAEESVGFLVDKNNKDELAQLADDLAIVSPLVDGRLRDVAEAKSS